jgi:hypothetical protein
MSEMRIGQLCKSLLIPLLLTLCACNSTNIRDISEIARAKNPFKQTGKILEQKGKTIVANPQALPEELRELKAKITIFKRLIDFDAGVVTVDTMAPGDQAGYLKKAIITTLQS